MSTSHFMTNAKNVFKKGFLGVALATTMLSSCGGSDEPTIEPKPPGPGTNPTPTVIDFQESGNGGYFYTKDSVVILYTRNAEFTLSVRKEDLKKANNIKLVAPALWEENIKGVNNGAVILENYDLDVDMSPLGSDYLGANGQKKLKTAKVKSMGLFGAKADANDTESYYRTKQEVVNIAKLLKDGPVALVSTTVNNEKYTY